MVFARSNKYIQKAIAYHNKLAVIPPHCMSIILYLWNRSNHYHLSVCCQILLSIRRPEKWWTIICYSRHRPGNKWCLYLLNINDRQKPKWGMLSIWSSLGWWLGNERAAKIISIPKKDVKYDSIVWQIHNDIRQKAHVVLLIQG